MWLEPHVRLWGYSLLGGSTTVTGGQGAKDYGKGAGAASGSEEWGPGVHTEAVVQTEVQQEQWVLLLVHIDWTSARVQYVFWIWSVCVCVCFPLELLSSNKRLNINFQDCDGWVNTNAQYT